MSLLTNAAKTKFLGLLPLFFLIGIGFFVRVTDLTQESVWLDEAFSVFMAQFDIGGIIEATSSDNHPPLYYILLKFWSSLVGTSEGGIRFLSLLFGIGLIPLTYLIGRRLFSEKVGLLAALFVTFSPILVWYSQEARSYAMLAFFCLLSFWSVCEATLKERWEFWALFIVSTAIMFYTHYFAFFFAALEAVAFLLLWKRDKLTFKYGFISAVVAVVLYIPWIVTILGKQLNPSGLFWATTSEHTFKLTLLQFVGGNPDSSLNIWNAPTIYEQIGMVVVPAVLLLGFAIAYMKKELKQYSIVILFAALPAFVAYYLTNNYSPMYHTRFFIYSVPFVFLGFAYAAANLQVFIPQQHKKRSLIPMNILAVALSASVLILMFMTWSFVHDRQDKEDWRAASDYIKAHAQPGDVIVTDPRYYTIPLSYYFGKREFSSQFTYKYEKGELFIFGNDFFHNADINQQMGLITRSSNRVWIVSNYGAQDGIKGWLEGNFAKIDQKDLSEIQVFLYQKR